MEFDSNHLYRDQQLPFHREKLLANALADLKNDQHVLGIYLSGSLAKGNVDPYSDIDLHTIVTPQSFNQFKQLKKDRASGWGDVLYHEGGSKASPLVVTHYEEFVKIDSWYHYPEELEPSIWLRDIEPQYDPQGIIAKIKEASSQFTYGVTAEEVESWRGKIFAFAHETYRAVMRNENYYALANVDKVRWYMAMGWYMEMDLRLDASCGVWSKLEGRRGHLSNLQLDLLEHWDCNRTPGEVMNTIKKIKHEFLRLNKELSRKTGLPEREALCKKVFRMIV
ncbi:nucleotidyltransferase domain-containing protein [Jeotgalibacillus sp. S-D1]|uniref:nucleotidyltransferase domain-containing protein n=1 Tax=Jeotgalibacillus sp. S-D1 TaxID=2552189 RepID=UPI00105A156A|nr:nucleotidyltransferase domain-containing protein [Jeotgalibacillus sp. S-D1]TDL31360.1 nucleotidyltransferase domain-containing protein [Jeotgalibacillus sp. S-D1]